MTPVRLGCVNEFLAPWAFLDEHVFCTKAGDAGLVYRLEGIDAESLDAPARTLAVTRIAAGLRQLSDSTRLYQYLIKRPAPPVHGRAVSTIELYVVVLAEGLARPWRPGWAALVAPDRTITLVLAQLDAAAVQVQRQADACMAHFAAAGPRRLAQAEVVAFLRQLVNDDRVDRAAPLPAARHLDYYLAETPVDCERDHLQLGDARITVLSMKAAPDATSPLCLLDLVAVPGDFIACLEWVRLPADRARRVLQGYVSYFHGRALRGNLRAAFAGGAEKDASVRLVDGSAVARRAQADAALIEIETQGRVLGEASLTIVLRNDDHGDTAAALSKVLATHGGALARERHQLLGAWFGMVPGNAVNAWLGTVPGNATVNYRRKLLLDSHVADLSLLFTSDTGQALDGRGRPPVATLVTQLATPYRLHLHVADVGHTLVLGQIGAGKTVTTNTLADGAQAYGGRTVIFDVRHDYRHLAARHGGSVVPLDGRGGLTLNPFRLTPTPDHLEFLAEFVAMLLEGRDGGRLTDDDRTAVYDAVQTVLTVDEIPYEARRLSGVARNLPRALKARLLPWLEGGQYGHVFDHVEDAVGDARFQVYDEMATLMTLPAVIEPLLFYILRRVLDRLDPAVFTLLVIEEAWRAVQHPSLRRFLQMALKTGRKENLSIIMATQAVEDFGGDDAFLRTVIESCPTTLFVANPSLDPAVYRELFHLNDRELALLQQLEPRRQVLLKRPTSAKVLDLVLPPDTPWLRAAPVPQEKEMEKRYA